MSRTRDIILDIEFFTVLICSTVAIIMSLNYALYCLLMWHKDPTIGFLSLILFIYLLFRYFRYFALYDEDDYYEDCEDDEDDF